MENYEHGLLFDPALSAEIKERFCYVDADPEFGKRVVEVGSAACRERVS